MQEKPTFQNRKNYAAPELGEECETGEHWVLQPDHVVVTKV